MKLPRHISLLAALLLCLVGGVAVAQQSRARITTDTNAITIGEQIRVQLEVITPKGSPVRWPIMRSVFPEQLEILQQSTIDTFYDPKAGDIQVMTQDLVLTAFDTGFFAVPPVPFPNEDRMPTTEAFLVSVYGVSVTAEHELNDIKGPLQVEFSWWEWFAEYWYWFAGGAVLLAALTWLSIYLWRKRSEPAYVAFRKPVDPPHAVALRALNALQEEQLWQKGKNKEFHVALSDIFRNYLEARFNIPALEQTTDEILRNLRTMPIDQWSKDQLEQILLLNDLVKFAKEQPTPTENQLAIDNIYRFVNQTRPVEDVADEQQPTEAPNTAQNSATE